MNVVLYTRAFTPAVGGMERFAEEVSLWLAAAGHTVIVLTRTAGEPTAVPVVARRPRALELGRALRGADVVHVNGLALRGLVPALLFRRPTVVTHAGHQAICPTGMAWGPGPCPAGPRLGPCNTCRTKGLRGQVSVLAHQAGARRARVNVCVSRYLHDRLGLPRSRAIYNPLASHRFAQDAQLGDDGVVAFAGRLVAEKGLDLLLRAMALLPEATLEAAGDGPMRGEWSRLAGDLGLSARVRFLGSLSWAGVADLYSRAAVVCVPSLWPEPFGYTASEGMALGKAVVATPKGALPELLADGRGLVASEVTAEALAQSLRDVIGDAERRRAVGRAALAFSRRELSLDAIGQRYVAAYEEAAR